MFDLKDNKSVKIIRPGYGFGPRYFDLVLEKSIKQDVKKGTPLSWEILL